MQIKKAFFMAASPLALSLLLTACDERVPASISPSTSGSPRPTPSVFPGTGQAPVFNGSFNNGTGIANQTFTVGTAIIPIDAGALFSDPNGDTLTFSAVGLPDGVTINPNTGVISGTPTESGTFTVTVSATDGTFTTTSNPFTVTVGTVAPTPSPNAPTFSGSIENDTLVVGTAIDPIDVSGFFSDPDGDNTLTFSAVGLPAGITIDPNTGIISGTPAVGSDADSPYTVTVIASDGTESASSNTFQLTVLPFATSVTAPSFSGSIEDETFTVGTPITVIDAGAFFSDPNNDPLSFSASGLPNGLTISSADGIISGTPDVGSEGTYSVTVTAFDGSESATSNTFTLTVAANAAPVFNGPAIGDQAFTVGGSPSIDVGTLFADANLDDTLTFTVDQLPAGLVIDSATGVISGTLTTAEVVNVTVTATDNAGATADSDTFTVTVTPNNAPTFAGPIASDTFTIGDAVTINAGDEFTDADPGDTLTFTSSVLPVGLVIDPDTGVISGTVTTAQTVVVTVTATDDAGATTNSNPFTLSVNTAPVFIGPDIPDQSFDELEAVTPILTAPLFTDADLGDVLTFSAVGLPNGVIIDLVTGIITGAPGVNTNLGSPFNVTVTATDTNDGATADSNEFEFVVTIP